MRIKSGFWAWLHKTTLFMKDLSGLTYSFQGWGPVLDFLSGVKQANGIKDIHITREGDKEWMMTINNTQGKANEKQRRPGAALYDLYW